MQIYKFGGASVKDASSVRNVSEILIQQGYKNKIVVVSAMGKTTNQLEEVVKYYFTDKMQMQQAINRVKNYHFQIIDDLFDDKNNAVYQEVMRIFQSMEDFLHKNQSPNKRFVYDQIVSIGEFLSTQIISHFLRSQRIENQWIDVRNLIKTDTNYQEANVLWNETQKAISEFDFEQKLSITQGFLGGDPNFFTTTLGREGSDYSAGIIAYCVEAQKLTIWKDVKGVLNADPRYFQKTTLLNQISYQEAIELAFYGASVIHPKTIQPLQQKSIPLAVRSFIDWQTDGTLITASEGISPQVPCFILKKNQHLLSLHSTDFSFINEDLMSYLFAQLSVNQVRMNMIQNSAISLSLCVEDKFGHIQQLINKLSERFKVSYVPDVQLYTIRHTQGQNDLQMINPTEILLKQMLQNTIQLVVKSPSEKI